MINSRGCISCTYRVELWPAKVQKSCFCKNTKWPQEVWCCLKLISLSQGCEAPGYFLVFFLSSTNLTILKAPLLNISVTSDGSASSQGHKNIADRGFHTDHYLLASGQQELSFGYFWISTVYMAKLAYLALFG